MKKNVMVAEYIFEILKPQLSNYKVLLHFTNDRHIAQDILKKGFEYSDYYENSSVEISCDLIDLRYKYYLYKAYGDFVVILCLPLKLFEDISTRAYQNYHDVLFNLGLSEYLPGNELEYRLHNRYVYGYMDLEKSKFHVNDLFGKTSIP